MQLLRKLIGIEPMKLEIIQPVLNRIALVISAAMVAHFFASFGTSEGQKWTLALIGIFVDVAAQYILALYKLRKRQKQPFVWLLFLAYMIYVVVFAMLSAINYCASGFVVHEQAERKVAAVENRYQKRLQQIDSRLETLNLQLRKEAETGVGKKSDELRADIEKLEAEQQEVMILSEKVSEVPKSSGSSLQTLSEILKLPENFLLILLFATATGMVYLILILTSWDLETESELEAKNELLKVTESSEKFEERFESLPESLQESSEVFETLPEVLEVQNSSPESLEKVPDEVKSSAESLTELKTFIDAAIRPTGTLNSAQKVAEKTGLPVEKCIEYRANLEGREIDGKPVVRKGRGASAVNFPKDVILQYVNK